jgi:hypothetical protein
MHRMLLITGAELLSDRRLHQLIFRYTGSARAARHCATIRRACTAGGYKAAIDRLPGNPTETHGCW